MKRERLEPCAGRAFGWSSNSFPQPVFLFKATLLLGLLAAAPIRTDGQWLTQSFNLKQGWNAVYLHVDASHAPLESVIGTTPANQIEELWVWSPNPSSAQFVTAPQAPSAPAYWESWTRTSSPSATLTRLRGNVACLVRCSSDCTWNLKGKPVPPSYRWTDSGLNFIGFPTAPNNPRASTASSVPSLASGRAPSSSRTPLARRRLVRSRWPTRRRAG